MEREKETSSTSQSSLSPLGLLGILFSSLVVLRFLSDANKIQHRPQPISKQRSTQSGNPANNLGPSNMPPSAANQQYDFYRCKDETPTWKKWTDISIGVVTIGLLLVNIGLLWTAKTSADTALRATNAAEGANKLAIGQLRPWLAVEMTKVGAIGFNPDGDAYAIFEFKIANLGHSPAIAINLVPELLNVPGLTNPSKFQEKLCTPLSNEPEAEAWGPALFPGRELILNRTVPISKAELDKRKDFGPTLIGCVDYMLSPKGEHHQSNFLYNSTYQLGANGQSQPLVKGQNIPAGKAVFYPLYQIGWGAN